MLVAVTVAVLGVVVVLVATYLILVIVALTRTHRHLHALAGGLEAVAANTRPLAERLETVNGAAGALLGSLQKVDANLKNIAVLLRM